MIDCCTSSKTYAQTMKKNGTMYKRKHLVAKSSNGWPIKTRMRKQWPGIRLCVCKEATSLVYAFEWMLRTLHCLRACASTHAIVHMHY